MTHWRPPPQIRLKALGLHWRGDRLLAAEVRDDAGQLKGVRPLGGSVEFGETTDAALIREFREELGITVAIVEPPVFMENIFTHEGHVGHEILAIYTVDFPAGAFDGVERLAFQETHGGPCFAEWFALDALDQPGQPQLFPSGLKAHLVSRG
ncbi:MAG: NUDIX hydrolase [Asticcacaulis sp.]